MIATESERSRPAAPERPSRRASWVRRMAVRKMERKVSVSITASMASCTAGRKAMACWLPLRASWSVSRRASSTPHGGRIQQLDGALAERVAVVEGVARPEGHHPEGEDHGDHDEQGNAQGRPHATHEPATLTPSEARLLVGGGGSVSADGRRRVRQRDSERSLHRERGGPRGEEAAADRARRADRRGRPGRSSPPMTATRSAAAASRRASPSATVPTLASASMAPSRPTAPTTIAANALRGDGHHHPRRSQQLRARRLLRHSRHQRVEDGARHR